MADVQTDPKGNVVLGYYGDDALLFRQDAVEQFVVAVQYDKDVGDWSWGHYFDDVADAIKYAQENCYGEFERAAPVREGSVHIEQVPEMQPSLLDRIKAGEKRFENENFDGVDLSHATLVDLSFINCSMRESFFDRARIIGCNFIGTDLFSAKFRSCSTISGVNFGSAELNFAVFNRSQLSHVDFTGANLTDVMFNDSTVERSTFHSVRIELAQFHNATLSSDSFSNARGKSADFSDAQIKKSSFIGAELPYSIWMETKLDDIEMWGCKLVGAEFTLCELDNVRAEHADIQNVLIERTQVKDSSFSLSSFKYSAFSLCELSNVDFDSANIESAAFNHATKAENCNFDGVKMTLTTSFENADFDEKSLASNPSVSHQYKRQEKVAAETAELLSLLEREARDMSAASEALAADAQNIDVPERGDDDER